MSIPRQIKFFFGQILQFNNAADLHQVDNKLIRCYIFFSERIQDLDNSQAFLDFIVQAKLWVIVDLGVDEDEQKIFDSINTTGQKLTATDIIKNAIFAKAIDLKTDYERLYKECWESVFEEEIYKEFWNQEPANKRIKRVQSEIFLHAFAVIEGFFDPDKDTLEGLSALYKRRIQDFDAKGLEAFLQSIRSYANIYRNLPYIKTECPLSFGDTEKRLLHILSVTETTTVMPLILFLKYHYDNKKGRNILETSLHYLEIFIVTRWLCHANTTEYSRFFAILVKKFDHTNPLDFLQINLYDVPSKEDLKSSLLRIRDRQNKRSKLVLFWIELYRRYQDKDIQDVIELPYNYTLEHLMPVSWQEHWHDVVRNSDEANAVIGQIGNMTLLKGKLNSVIGNAPWQIKLHGDGTRKNCISNCADLLITREILDHKRWGKSEVNKRSKRLIEQLFNIWDVDLLGVQGSKSTK